VESESVCVREKEGNGKRKGGKRRGGEEVNKVENKNRTPKV